MLTASTQSELSSYNMHVVKWRGDILFPLHSGRDPAIDLIGLFIDRSLPFKQRLTKIAQEIKLRNGL